MRTLRDMARIDPQVNFRIPASLNDLIKEAAASNNRTITAELVSRLEQSFSGTTVTDAEIESIKLAFGHGFAAAMIYSLGKKLREEVEFRIPDTSPDVLELLDDTVKLFLEQLERDHKYAAGKLANPSIEPTIKRIPRSKPVK